MLGGTAGDEVDVETDSGRAGETEDGEDGEGIWTITREQRAYYVKQFAGMQSDLERGRIQGRQAKEFFEKRYGCYTLELHKGDLKEEVVVRL